MSKRNLEYVESSDITWSVWCWVTGDFEKRSFSDMVGELMCSRENGRGEIGSH